MNRIDRIAAAIAEGRPIEPEDRPAALDAIRKLPQPTSEGLAERNRLIRQCMSEFYLTGAKSGRDARLAYLSDIRLFEATIYQRHVGKMQWPALSPKERLFRDILDSCPRQPTSEEMVRLILR